MLFDLCRFALTEKLLVTHEAMATGHLEWDDDPVSGLNGSDVLPNLLDDPNRFVAENVTRLHEGGQRLVEMEIGTADVRACDPDDRVGRFFDDRVRYRIDAHASFRLPSDCLHVDPFCFID